MRSHKFSTGLRAAVIVTLLASTAWAATEKVLHNFGHGKDGSSPQSSLIFDAAGNLYGTTDMGGDNPCGGGQGCGTVFELTPKEGGGWTEKVLHNFGHGMDGTSPQAGLILDSAGNLYGTTWLGGVYGVGTVFELTPKGDGGWTEKVLHNFGHGKDGAYPVTGLVFDTAGNLYGTTSQGGTNLCEGYGCGMAFELMPREGGGWTEKTLHNFGKGMDGFEPYSSLIFDSAGNLYGTTVFGGDYLCEGYGCGIVFELTPGEGGGWTEKTLHNFGKGMDGTYPQGGLIFDDAGNLYGTTTEGGDYACSRGCGTVFELTPREGGGWTEKALHNFGVGHDEGTYPWAGLVFDAAGNLFGTATGGRGKVFELTPNQGGGWTEKTLYVLGRGKWDQAFPAGDLIVDAAGHLYGTTFGIGDRGVGIVFEITP